MRFSSEDNNESVSLSSTDQRGENVARLSAPEGESVAEPERTNAEIARAMVETWVDHHRGTVAASGHAQDTLTQHIKAALDAKDARSRPTVEAAATLAHVEGCPKNFSVPVDLCECGGRVIVWSSSVEAAEIRHEFVAGSLCDECGALIRCGLTASAHAAPAPSKPED